MKHNYPTRRSAAALVCAGLTLMLLTACSGHTHSFNRWSADPTNHWHTCECGETADRSAHSPDGSHCTVCGCDIFTPDDESIHIAFSNEQGNYVYYARHALDGSVISAFEYEYGDGWMTETEYAADILTARREYALDPLGNQTTLKDISYSEDGSFTVTAFDEYGNETLSGRYAADGRAESEITYENVYDANGNRTLCRTYTDGVLTQEMEFRFGSDAEGSWSTSGKTTTYHEDGSKTVEDSAEDSTWATTITYDANGVVTEEIRYVYEYNDQGEAVGAKGYRNGTLFEESRSTRGPNGEALGFAIISYEEDGSKTVWEYDDKLAMVKETVYDAHGHVISD